jgi:hypothetical protein
MIMANTETTTDIQTNVGTITVINTSRRNKPKGIKRPFDYVMKISEVKALADETKAFISQFAELPVPQESQKVNYPLRPDQDQVFRSEYPLSKPRIWLNVSDKLHSGSTFHVSIETSSFVVTQRQWNAICTGLQAILTKHLGEDAKLFSDEYFYSIKEPEFYHTTKNENYLKEFGARPTPSSHRLYARFDTEIMFEEMIQIQTSAKTVFQSYPER